MSAERHSIEDLAQLVQRYIIDEDRRDGSDEVGYHIGGFDRQGKPRLYHVFWGFDRPKPKAQIIPSDHFHEHSDWAFLYNGRNDLAHVVFSALLEEIRKGEDIHFNLATSIGRICLCDFVARFAAEITPQVGPPFVLHLIFPDNSIEKIENTSFSPISVQRLVSVLPRLLQEGTVYPLHPSADSTTNQSSPTGTPTVIIEETTHSPHPGTLNYVPPSGIKDEPP